MDDAAELLELTTLCNQLSTVNLLGDHASVISALMTGPCGGIQGLQKDVLAQLLNEIHAAPSVRASDQAGDPSLFHLKLSTPTGSSKGYTLFGTKENFNSRLWAYKWKVHSESGRDGVAVAYILKRPGELVGAFILKTKSTKGRPIVGAISATREASVFDGSWAHVDTTVLCPFTMWARLGNITFCGNPGVGKSTIVNLLCAKPMFKSGESTSGRGITDRNQSVQMEFGALVDTPGVFDCVMRNAASIVNEAIAMSEKQLFCFVVTSDAGRFHDDDAKCIRGVLAATGVEPSRLNDKFMIVINKCSRIAMGKDMSDITKGSLAPFSTSLIHKIPMHSNRVSLANSLVSLWDSFMNTEPALVYRSAVQNLEITPQGIDANLARATLQRHTMKQNAMSRAKSFRLKVKRTRTLRGLVNPEHPVTENMGSISCSQCCAGSYGLGASCRGCDVDICQSCFSTLEGTRILCSEPFHVTTLVFNSGATYSECSTAFCDSCFRPMMTSEFDSEPIHWNHEMGCCVCADCVMLLTECPACTWRF